LHVQLLLLLLPRDSEFQQQNGTLETTFTTAHIHAATEEDLEQVKIQNKNKVPEGNT
jgi:hypothetical protein